MNAPRDTRHDDCLLQGLTDLKEATAYLNAVMEQEDPTALTIALRQVAKAQGLDQVSIQGETVEKPLIDVLSEKEELTIETLNQALHALGLRLSFKPAPKASQKSS